MQCLIWGPVFDCFLSKGASFTNEIICFSCVDLGPWPRAQGLVGCESFVLVTREGQRESHREADDLPNLGVCGGVLRKSGRYPGVVKGALPSKCSPGVA